VFTAGTGPIDPVSAKVVGSTIEEQTHQTLKNIGAILEAAGATYADVVKATVHLSDPLLFPRFNAVYSQYFQTRNRPAPRLEAAWIRCRA